MVGRFHTVWARKHEVGHRGAAQQRVQQHHPYGQHRAHRAEHQQLLPHAPAVGGEHADQHGGVGRLALIDGADCLHQADEDRRHDRHRQGHADARDDQGQGHQQQRQKAAGQQRNRLAQQQPDTVRGPTGAVRGR
ncbi:MAG: hypothetical protein R3E83_00575 [Burkholderiaceae bacterium]